MDDMEEGHLYYIAFCILTGIVVLPLFIIWVTSFFTCRTYRDPARRPFTIMKVTYPFFFTAYTCIDIGSVCFMLLTYGPYYEIYDVDRSLEETANHVHNVGSLFHNVGLLLLSLCIVDLGLSFLYIWSGNRTHHKLVLGMAVFFTIAPFAVNLAAFGTRAAYYTDVFGNSGRRTTMKKVLDMQKLRGAFNILLWILSLGIAALTAYVFSVSRKQTRLRRNAQVYLAIGVLFLLRCTYYLAYDVQFVLNFSYRSKGPGVVYDILEPVLGTWPTFIVLVLIFTIGCRKRDAFRSVEAEPKQQFYVPTPIMYYPAPQNGQHYPVPPNGQQQYQAQPNYQAPHVQQNYQPAHVQQEA